MSDEHLPDVSLIGEMGDVTELGKLVQLVLGCAVSCEKKQGDRLEAEQNPVAPSIAQIDQHCGLRGCGLEN